MGSALAKPAQHRLLCQVNVVKSGTLGSAACTTTALPRLWPQPLRGCDHCSMAARGTFSSGGSSHRGR